MTTAPQLDILRPGEKVVDLFCGCGGWTASPLLHEAGIRVDYAVNHSPSAIEWHARNNPHCKHFQGDAWKARPREITGDEPVGLLLASAACTTHSNARGAAPISPRVHMLGWCIARWIVEKRPRVVEVENVPEWKKWGPLVPQRDGRGAIMRDPVTGKIIRLADKSREGSHFRRWVRYCQRLGYQVEHRVLDAADFGNASRRKRLFIKMRCDGQPIQWPAATHGGEKERGGLFAGSLTPHRAAAEVIDWSDLGRSIFDGRRSSKSYRGTRLAKKTLARTCEGIGRFVLEEPKPFTLRLTHGEGKGWHVHPSDHPLPTQTGRQDLALITPMVGRNSQQGSMGPCCAPADKPMSTQTTCQDAMLISPILAPQNTGVFGHSVDRPGPAITTKGHQSLIAPVLATTRNGEREGQRPRCNPVDDPLNTVVNGPTQGIASAVLMNNNTGNAPQPLDRPLPTLTTGDHAALVSAILLPAGGPSCNPSPADEPLGTILTRDHRGIAVPVMMAHRNHAVGSDPREPMPALCSGGTHNGMAAPVCVEYYGQTRSGRQPGETLGCVVTHDRHGIATPCLAEPFDRQTRQRAIRLGKLLRFFLGERVRLNAEGMALAVIDGAEFVIVDILFRMLRPRELARAMGFPDSFALPTVQREAVRLIGNAVAVPQAAALILASFPGMRPPTPTANERRAAA